MGVVVRQSFWSTVIAYTGVIIGYFNTLYLRPEFMSLDQIGIFTLVTANAMLISPLCSAGMTGTFIKYFPEIGDDRTLRNQFFTFQVLIILAVNVLVITLGYLNRDFIASLFTEKAPLYTNYLSITVIVIIVNSLFNLFFGYCRSLLKVVVPSLLRDIFLRIGAIILIGGLALELWDFDIAVRGLAINYLLALAFLLGYLIVGHGLRFTMKLDRIDGEWKRKILNFGLYSMVLASSFAAMNNVNYLQVSTIVGDRANGIFTTCFFIGMIVEMPRQNMLKVISPILSSAMKTGDMVQVSRVYKKGSITMSVFGFLLLIGILTNVNDLFAFIPQGSGFAEGYWVVVAVCSAKLLIMLFSFSQEIIVFSEDYKMILYFQLISAIILVTLNIIFLPIWGLTGAGISYLITIAIHTLLKFSLLYRKYDLSPFSKNHLPLLIISGVVFASFWLIPFPFSPVINILVRSALTTLVFVVAIFKLEISSDINQLIRTTFEKIKFSK